MKIERINNNKIKVTLSLQDLKTWDIDIENISYNSIEAQKMFWNLLKKAEKEIGFYVNDCQLIVEAMPSKKEGFIIIITKIEDDEDFESIHKYIKNKFKKSELRVKRKTNKISSGIIIYSFNNFEDICSLSTQLSDIYEGESTLYKYKDIYYLILTQNCTINSNLKTVESILNEYGNKITPAYLKEGLLIEHSTKIIENNALQILRKHFSS